MHVRGDHKIKLGNVVGFEVGLERRACASRASVDERRSASWSHNQRRVSLSDIQRRVTKVASESGCAGQDEEKTESMGMSGHDVSVEMGRRRFGRCSV